MVQRTTSLLALAVLWAAVRSSEAPHVLSDGEPVNLAAMNLAAAEADDMHERCAPYFDFFQKQCESMAGNETDFTCTGGVRSEDDSFRWCATQNPYFFRWGEPVCYVHTSATSLWTMSWCRLCLGSICMEPIKVIMVIFVLFILCNCACCALICRCVYKKADEHDIPRRIRASIAGGVLPPGPGRPSQLGVELNEIRAPA
mmetsp:Transcript_42389/g.79035  ORF Transcript_42389/g.79035 Transcript_42389/m.79035 type:complete len:200 (+) Transcript_42389:24-623(+)